MQNLLSELKNIGWEQLSHAYGSAEDVPEILEDLYLLEDEKELQDCMQELWSNIYHQGTIYEATAYAIPFLSDLFQHKANLQKAIFHLLVAIYEGNYRKAVAKDAKTEILKGIEHLQNFVNSLNEEEKAKYQLEKEDFSLLKQLLP